MLEEWLRDRYFSCEVDIGSSGVEPYSLRELRAVLAIEQDELDEIVLSDSPSTGTERLRDAIGKQFANGRPELAMATHGSSEAIFLVIQSLLQKGDEVVVADPAYHALSQGAEAVGCRVVRWPLLFEEGFTSNLDLLRRCVTRHTRMIAVNFPHNPTGSTVTAKEQNEIVKIASRVGAYLIWDSAFASLIFEGSPLPEPSTLYERCISTGTLSKAFGLPGLRVGWLIAQPDIIARCVRLRDYTTLSLSPLTEWLATKTLENATAVIQPRLQQARLNRETLEKWIEGHAHSIRWVRPRGGVCAFLRVRDEINTMGFCSELAVRWSVLLVPGMCFRMPEFVRLGFGGSHLGLLRGLSCMSTLLTEHFDRSPMAYPSSNSNRVVAD